MRTTMTLNLNNLETELKNFLTVYVAELWKYEPFDDNFTLCKDKEKILVVKKGQTAEAIRNNKPFFTNHAISDKDYNKEVDNPFSYKIKSILIIPLSEKDKLIGFLRLYRNTSQRKNFILHDIERLEPFYGKLKSILTKKEKKESSIVKNSEKELTKSLVEELDKYKKLLKDSENSLQDYKNKINFIEEAFNQQKQQNINLEKENSKYQQKLQDIQKKYQLSKKLFSEKANEPFLEQIMKKIYLSINQQEHLMTFLNIIIFMNNYKEIPNSLNKIFKEKRIITDILSSCTLKRTLKEEKYNVEKFLNKINYYCQDYLKENDNTLKFSIVQDNLPSLIFNASMAENIIVRTIMKAQEHTKHGEEIKIKLDFKNNILSITIDFILNNNKNILALFVYKKDLLNEKNELFYQFNKKLLHAYGGEISTNQTKKQYTLFLNVPAYIIKL